MCLWFKWFKSNLLDSNNFVANSTLSQLRSFLGALLAKIWWWGTLKHFNGLGWWWRTMGVWWGGVPGERRRGARGTPGENLAFRMSSLFVQFSLWCFLTFLGRGWINKLFWEGIHFSQPFPNTFKQAFFIVFACIFRLIKVVDAESLHVDQAQSFTISGSNLALALIESCATNIVRTQNILFPSADFLILTPFACRSWFWQGNFWLFQAVWHSLRLQEFWMVFSWRTLFFPIRNWKIQYFKHSFWLFLMIFGFT